MGSSGKSQTEYIASPEQRQILNMFMPVWARAAGAGSGGQYQMGTQYTPSPAAGMYGGYGATSSGQMAMDPADWARQWGWHTPMPSGYPTQYGSAGAYGGMAQQPYTSSPIYGQSSGNAWTDLGVPMPTDQLMSSISPSIKAGVWQPYQEAWNNLYSSALGEGLGVSARGGWSGQVGNLFTDFASKAGTQYGQQLWNMVNPNMMAAWQMPYQMAMGSLGQTLPTNVYQPGGSSGFNMGGAMSGAGMGLGIGSLMAPAGATGLAALGGPAGLGIAGGLGLLGGMSGK